MNPDIERDIRIIYRDTFPDNLIDQLISHINDLLDRNENTLYPHTKSDKTENILEWNKTKYFSILHTKRVKPVVLAGAIEKKIKSVSVPAIRFFEDNPLLRNIPSELLFPYRKPKWTNVELNENTIIILPELFDTQVQLFIQRYIH